MITATRQAEELLAQALKELEFAKGSVLTGIQRLLRGAKLVGDEDTAIWCEIQLGNAKYVRQLALAVESDSLIYVDMDRHVRQTLEELPRGRTKAKRKVKAEKTEKEKTESAKQVSDWDKKVAEGQKHLAVLTTIGLKEEIHFTREEQLIKAKAGGGYRNIGTIEEILASLVRKKVGNDGTFYTLSLNEHINYVRRVAHEKATRLYNRVVFSNTPQTSLDILRGEVDERLLDLAPELAEKLMIAFKSVASQNPEEWSQALATCRRFLEALADVLYPPSDVLVNGRTVGKAQYINRLWAFMDSTIKSDSNKELAEAHILFLGSYLQKTHALGHKGVHAQLKRVEAIKAVFHTYLVVADLLEYLKRNSDPRDKRINIHVATLDELESILGVSRSVAREIIKLRVEYGILDVSRLGTINGIGKKTLSQAEKLLSFEPAKSPNEA